MVFVMVKGRSLIWSQFANGFTQYHIMCYYHSTPYIIVRSGELGWVGVCRGALGCIVASGCSLRKFWQNHRKSPNKFGTTIMKFGYFNHTPMKFLKIDAPQVNLEFSNTGMFRVHRCLQPDVFLKLMYTKIVIIFVTRVTVLWVPENNILAT